MKKLKVNLEWVPTVALVAIFISVIVYKQLNKKKREIKAVTKVSVTNSDVEDSDIAFWSSEEKCTDQSLKEICKNIEFITLLDPDQGLIEHEDSLFFYLNSNILKLKNFRYRYKRRDLKVLKNKLKSKEDILADYKHPNSSKSEEDWVIIAKMLAMESGIAEYAIKNKKSITFMLDSSEIFKLSNKERNSLYYINKYWGKHAIASYKMYLHSNFIDPLSELFLKSIQMYQEHLSSSKERHLRLSLKAETEGIDIKQALNTLNFNYCYNEYLKKFCKKINYSVGKNMIKMNIFDKKIHLLVSLNNYNVLYERYVKKHNLSEWSSRDRFDKASEVFFELLEQNGVLVSTLEIKKIVVIIVEPFLEAGFFISSLGLVDV